MIDYTKAYWTDDIIDYDSDEKTIELPREKAAELWADYLVITRQVLRHACVVFPRDSDLAFNLAMSMLSDI